MFAVVIYPVTILRNRYTKSIAFDTKILSVIWRFYILFFAYLLNAGTHTFIYITEIVFEMFVVVVLYPVTIGRNRYY